MIAQSREARFERSRVGISQAGSTVIEPGARIGLLQADTVNAGGDIRTTFLISGGVTAEGRITTTFDARSAAALGGGFVAACAAAWLLVRRAISRTT